MIRPHVDRLKRWQELKVKNRPVSLAKDYDGLFLLFLSLILESMLRKSSKTSMLQIQTHLFLSRSKAKNQHRHHPISFGFSQPP